MNDRKAYNKIYLLLGALFMLIIGATLYIVDSNTDDIVSKLTMEQANMSSRALESHLRDLNEKVLMRAEIIADYELLKDAVRERDFETLADILEHMGFDMDFAFVCDEKGSVLAKKHSGMIGGNLTGYPEIAGIVKAGYNFDVKIEYIDSLGFVIRANVLIFSGGEPAGVVVCGYDLANPMILDQFTDRNPCEASIFYGSTRINTTVTDENNILILGKDLDPRIAETVLVEKVNFTERLELFGTIYSANYSPIITDGQAIGILFTGVDIDLTLDQQRNMKVLIILIALLAIGAAIILFFTFKSISLRFSTTLTELSDKTESMGILENVLDALDIYLYVTEPETGKVLYTNRAVIEHLGFTSSVVGEYCWNVFQKGMGSRCDYCPLDKLMANPGEVAMWDAVNTITGRHYKNIDRLIDWPGYKKVQFCQRIDITQTKCALEKAEQASRAKGDFLSRMSHEMRTPLNAIIGMISLARKAGDISEAGEYLDKANASSEHLLAVINDILDISTIETGKIELSQISFTFMDLIDQITAVIGFKIDEKKQKLQVHTAEDVPASIIADRQRLAQVIINLLSNANKFTPEHGHITLSISNAEDLGQKCMLLFEVEDNGIGVTAEQRERIFSAFEQADNSISRHYGGNGLGLAICSSIVKSMNGDIWVKSKPDKGCVFGFKVPVGIVTNAGYDSSDNGLASNAGDIANIFAGKSILLAEDVEINREIFIALLEDTGVKVDCAENGAVAYDMFATNPELYDLIFMDIHMPEMDGHEATHKIRGMDIPRAKDIPIIAVTADVLVHDIEKCLASGINDHVGKPLDINVVIAKMKQYML